MQLNSKILASYVATQVYYSQLGSFSTPSAPSLIGTKGRICQQVDFSEPWFFYWTQQIRMAPLLHRKVWEDAYVVQSLWERDCLAPGKVGLGFAVGAEALPSYFAKCGVRVLASDLASDDERSRGWRDTGQHAQNLQALWKPDIVDRQVFLENCSYKSLDMNVIPDHLNNSYDFCWSVCSLEHLGSIENGLNFIVNAMRVLKPGGIAVHTTEFNLDNSETIDNWPTVLFQRAHFEDLRLRLERADCRLVDIDFSPGTGLLNSYIDVPPFPHQMTLGLNDAKAPHIKLSVEGFPTTSIAFMVEKGR